MKRVKLLLTLAVPVILMQHVQAQSNVRGNERTTSTVVISRLTGASTYLYTGINFWIDDSTTYQYSDGRGGDLNHTLKYDFKNYAMYDAADSLFDLNVTRNDQGFDGNNNIIYNETDAFSTVWNAQNKFLYYWNTSVTPNIMTQQIYQIWNGSSYQSENDDLYTYITGTSNLYEDDYQNYNGSIFVDSLRKFFQYNSMGGVTWEQDYALVGTNWQQIQSYFYGYNSSNQMTSKTFATWNNASGVWDTSYMYSYVYDSSISSGNLVAIQYQTYNAASASWTNSKLQTYTSFSGSLPLIEEDFMWADTGTTGGGTWYPSKMYNYSYNSFGQMTTKLGTSYNSSVPGFENAAGDTLAHYYYDTVVINAVKNVANANFTVDAFPVPAQSIVNISISGEQSSRYDIVLTDLNGRIIRSWTVPATNKYQSIIPTDNMATGMYLLTINSDNGQITKQISVMH